MSDLQDEFYERLVNKKIDVDRGLKGSRAKTPNNKKLVCKKEQIDRQSPVTASQINKASKDVKKLHL